MDTEDINEHNEETTTTNTDREEVVATEAAVKPHVVSSSSKPLLVKEPTLREEVKKIASAIATNPFYPEATYTLHWRDPIRTGLLFGIFNFAFFLVTYGEYSVVTLITYCALAILVVAFAYANGSILFAKYIQGLDAENPLSSRWSNAEPVPRYLVEKHLDSVLNVVNAVLDVSRDIFYCNFPFLSIKVASILFILSVFGKWFSGLTLLYIVTVITFAWPRIYEEKKELIDQQVKIVFEHIDTYTRVALAKLPKLDKRKTQ